jgi:SAM-dependent methyltransferase
MPAPPPLAAVAHGNVRPRPAANLCESSPPFANVVAPEQAGQMTNRPKVNDDVTETGVFQAVLDGYEAVYDALGKGPTFNRLWRANAYGGDFPEEFAHIGFLTEPEAQRLRALLHIEPGGVLVDLACGAGGPGLWMAREAGASLIGVDPSAAGLAAARARAAAVGLADRARFVPGTFERTGLPAAAADALMSIEAFQYAPDKAAACAEFFRVLRPSARLGIICFEVDPAKAAGLPVLGVDPVADYRPLLEAAGFTIEAYEETPGWEERVYGVFTAVVEHNDALVAEMGPAAAAGVVAEAMLTVAVRPYPRRVLVVASRPV